MSSTPDSSSTSSRLAATVVLWLLLIVAMVALSLVLGEFVGVFAIIVPVIFTIAGIVLSGFIWNWGQLPNSANSEQANEDRKRNRLTQALRDLSDEELKNLRDRLSSGDIDHEQVARLLDETETSKVKRA